MIAQLWRTGSEANLEHGLSGSVWQLCLVYNDSSAVEDWE